MDSKNTINIVNYVIRNTPYGHLKETIENLKSLVGSSIINNENVQKEIVAYEEEHFKQVGLQNEKIVLSKYNKDSDGFYHDQSKNIKILINPLQENIEKIERINRNDAGEESNSNIYTDEFSKNLHKSLGKLAIDYKDRCYKSGVAAVNGKIYLNSL